MASPQSLLLFPPAHPLRRNVIALVENVWFDRLVISLILANCVTMALKDPLSTEPAWSVAVEWVFSGLFTLEMLLKQLAMGVTGSRRA